MGFRVWDLGFGVGGLGFEFGIWDLGRVWGSGFWGFVMGVWGLGFGFGILGFGV